MIIILLGAPASGKGTQAEMLAKEFNLYLLHTGDLVRKLAETDTEIKKIADSGQLIPSELMTMHLINFLTTQKPDLKDILFDGFPRFVTQYEALESFLKSKGDDIDVVFSLDVSKEVSIQRISARRLCRSCNEVYNLMTKPPKVENLCDLCGGELYQRDDDNPDAVKVRFEFYQKNTEELINHLDSKGKLIRVRAERPIDEIYKDLSDKVKAVSKSRLV